jgi:enoyl-[acyl-carrier protein] reductase III
MTDITGIADATVPPTTAIADPDRPDLGLSGKVAVVTGATRGIGLAVARRLCAAGCQVVLNYAHSEADAAAAAEQLSALKGSAEAVRADVTDRAQLMELLARVRERYGRLDVFVHNAASWHPTPTLAADPEHIRADLDAALSPLIYGAGPIAELMAGRPGRIVAISSSGARSVIPQYVGLGMAKSALEGLVRYLAVELAGRGVAVNAVSTAKVDKGAATSAPDAAAALAARTPAGRLTTPDDVADVVALLCTAEAGWIHGEVITADGGLRLRS